MIRQWTRRLLLRRAPAVPFAIGAAVSQVPNLVQNQMPMAERVRWFVFKLAEIEKPLSGKPEEWSYARPVSYEVLQQMVRWENYTQQLRYTATWAGITLEKAAEIVGHTIQ